MLKYCTIILLITALITACDFAGISNKEVPTPEAQRSHLISTGHELSPHGECLLMDFLHYLPAHVVTCAEADVTDDGITELIVVYGLRSAPDQMFMCLIFVGNGGFTLSNVMPAPIENQRITFRNIDEKPPLEFIIMGSKGIYTGFAIYRVVDGVVEDLFDDGMEGCC